MEIKQSLLDHRQTGQEGFVSDEQRTGKALLGFVVSECHIKGQTARVYDIPGYLRFRLLFV